MQEILFHCGDSTGKSIAKPNLEYCNIKLTIACAMHACGASGIISKIYKDDDDDKAIVNFHYSHKIDCEGLQSQSN